MDIEDYCQEHHCQGGNFTVEELANVLNRLVAEGKGKCEAFKESAPLTVVEVYSDYINFE